MSRYRKIAITLPAETLLEVENRRRRTGESRSALLRRALGLLLGTPDRVADGEQGYARTAVAGPRPSPRRTREERLDLFDETTRRLARWSRRSGPAPRSRGWTREDLHDRDQPD